MANKVINGLVAIALGLTVGCSTSRQLIVAHGEDTEVYRNVTGKQGFNVVDNLRLDKHFSVKDDRQTVYDNREKLEEAQDFAQSHRRSLELRDPVLRELVKTGGYHFFSVVNQAGDIVKFVARENNHLDYVELTDRITGKSQVYDLGKIDVLEVEAKKSEAQIQYSQISYLLREGKVRLPKN